MRSSKKERFMHKLLVYSRCSGHRDFPRSDKKNQAFCTGYTLQAGKAGG
jgi:hypothetical protein